MIHAQKAALRAAFRARRAALSEDERAKRDKSICTSLLSLLDGVDLLLLFDPKGAEIDLRPIFHYARERGIACAFPRCGEEKGEMDFYFVNDLNELEEGKFGIREPQKNTTTVTDLTNAMMIVPALAFDRAGYRIGYGGGYYDRYLQAHGVKTVGVVYEEFLADTLPHERFDLAVDIIVTEKRTIRI